MKNISLQLEKCFEIMENINNSEFIVAEFMNTRENLSVEDTIFFKTHKGRIDYNIQGGHRAAKIKTWHPVRCLDRHRLCKLNKPFNYCFRRL